MPIHGDATSTHLSGLEYATSTYVHTDSCIREISTVCSISVPSLWLRDDSYVDPPSTVSRAGPSGTAIGASSVGRSQSGFAGTLPPPPWLGASTLRSPSIISLVHIGYLAPDVCSTSVQRVCTVHTPYPVS